MTLNRKRKVVKISFAIAAMFLCGINVQADTCSYVEKANLNETASKVKTNYEVIEEKKTEEFLDPDTLEVGTYETIKTTFKISIYNITKDLYITQNNNLTNELKTIIYEDTENGVYTFTTEDTENIIKYEYQIFSNLENCMGDILKTYSFLKPKENVYSQYRMCEGLEDIPYCKTYLTEDLNMSESELKDKINNYLTKDEDKTPTDNEEGIKEYLKENYVYVIAGAVLIVGTLITTVIIVKKRSAL